MTDNQGKSRFELAVDGQVAFADYWRDGDRLVIPHVETPQALRGHGVAARLMEGIVAHAREAGLKIVPVCTYAQAWMRRHREHEDILA
ncbi:N-acetyltransferase [Phenylobacterium montanum]|uniref:N-acetyltransferase n=1 Tax=Phenylobacterium montanum TaxID=2823693 RepID=A0A975G5Y9_9CAUL|nr:N-acetyltransferase [Caulobacter sp. S6]